MAYSVAQRTSEIGIRVALRARSSNITLFVLRQGISLTLLGLFIGSIAAATVGRLIPAKLVYGGAAGFTIVVTVCDAEFPIWRASHRSSNIAKLAMKMSRILRIVGSGVWDRRARQGEGVKCRIVP